MVVSLTCVKRISNQYRKSFASVGRNFPTHTHTHTRTTCIWRDNTDTHIDRGLSCVCSVHIYVIQSRAPKATEHRSVWIVCGARSFCCVFCCCCCCCWRRCFAHSSRVVAVRTSNEHSNGIVYTICCFFLVQFRRWLSMALNVYACALFYVCIYVCASAGIKLPKATK